MRSDAEERANLCDCIGCTSFISIAQVIVVVSSMNVTATQMLHIRQDMNGKGEMYVASARILPEAADQLRKAMQTGFDAILAE